MAVEDRTFQCVVIAPTGKRLDCRTTSVVFPAHDGQVGVWTDHMPMFCMLGLGIMEVKAAAPAAQAPESTFMLIDGGFAMVCSNLLKVVSYDVVSLRDTKPEAIDQMRTSLSKKLQAGALDPSDRLHVSRKLSMLNRLVELSAPVGQPN